MKNSCPCLYLFYANFTTLKAKYFTKLDSYVLSMRCPIKHMVYRDTEAFIDHCNHVGDRNYIMVAEYLTKLCSFDKKESRMTGKR